MTKKIQKHETTTLDRFALICDKLAEEFIIYMYWEYDGSPIEWIADDPTGTFECWDYYWSLSDCYSVLLWRYDQKVVFAHYNYILDYSWDDREYYINLHAFSHFYKWEPLEEFAKPWRNRQKSCLLGFSRVKRRRQKTDGRNKKEDRKILQIKSNTTWF